ncbi:MAG: MBL fold metallo-hydrolase [Methylobacterium sp.]|uniref:MBL fold metallo-hydrolase n=1 Tax=Methylobacterium sp. TaxID=409 RepID=UPI0025EAFB5D|nr:MBL fold metallo-hydrolase [Methylobacterium sp.]MBX9930929.1 MBL fold metallo-hydrolase [Methylobacterium sp.]
MKRRSLLAAVSAATVMTLGGVGYAAHRRARNPYYDGPRSDHFDGIRFHSPDQATDKDLAEVIRWQLARAGEAWPSHFPSPHVDTPPERAGGLRVALIGHASYLFQVAGRNILVDPVYAKRASPLRFAGPKRVNPPGIAFDKLPPIDVVLITHNHYDHLDGPTMARLWQAHQPLIVAPLGNDTILRSYDDTMHVLAKDWGESVDLGGGVTAHLTPANHWSARGLNDRRMALWCSYVLTGPTGTHYHSGDTGLGDGAIFRDARSRFGPARLATLPIGAYEPRWFMKGQHMNPADAVEAALLLEAKQALGHHWGTFRLTDEGVERPVEALAAACAERGGDLSFRALHPGEVWSA